MLRVGAIFSGLAEEAVKLLRRNLLDRMKSKYEKLLQDSKEKDEEIKQLDITKNGKQGILLGSYNDGGGIGVQYEIKE